MITLHHLDQSRSERIIWLLEELSLPYRLEVFLRQPDLYAPPALQAAHALGRAPVITDGDVVLAESGAIVEYLIARHGQGRLSVPPEAPNFADYLYWLHYAEGSLILQFQREWSLGRMLPDADAHPGMARVRAGTRTHLDGVEARLASSPFFAGPDLTAADIMMAYPFTTFRRICPVDRSRRSGPGSPGWKRVPPSSRQPGGSRTPGDAGHHTRPIRCRRTTCLTGNRFDADLFSPSTLNDVTLRNRIAMSPMTMYRSVDGKVDDYHVMLMGSRAAGGFGLVFPEQIAITPDGRTGTCCAGIWDDNQVEDLARMCRMVKSFGAAPAI